MAVNIFSTNLNEIDNDQFCRFDIDYLYFAKTVFNVNNRCLLKNYLTSLQTGQPISREDYSDEGKETNYVHLVVRNIKFGKLYFHNPIFINDEKGEELESYKIRKGEIIIAISANCGHTFYYEGNFPDVQLTLSHYLARITIDETKLNAQLLVHYLNSETIQKYFRATETGKTQKNLSKVYIRELPILLPEKIDIQEKILEKLQPIEIEISELQKQIRPQTEVMNRLFEEALQFDIEHFNQLKQVRLYSLDLEDFASETDTRLGCRFHNKAGEFVEVFLKSKTNKRIKDFISEPIVLGCSVSPSQYDEDGNYFYIAMSNIKNWQFEQDDCKCIGDEFYYQNIKKTIKCYDILMARSGEGTIGKVAIILDEEQEGVFADFTMRIRLTGINPLFAYYYFRTEIFQHMVYTHKKGLGNNTNIFPSQVKNFPMPDFSDEKQNEIVQKVQLELKKQKNIEVQILEKQKKISKIIEEAINQSS